VAVLDQAETADILAATVHRDVVAIRPKLIQSGLVEF
jgi:hypothetical protein